MHNMYARRLSHLPGGGAGVEGVFYRGEPVEKQDMKFPPKNHFNLVANKKYWFYK